MRILHLIPDLDYGGAARQLTLLGSGLPRGRFDVRVCVVRRDGPLAPPLRDAGVRVEVLNWTRLLDLAPLWRLRRLVREFQPEVLHVWRPWALRIAGLLGGSRRRHLVVSDPLPAMHRRGAEEIARLDRRLLRRAARVVVENTADAAWLDRLGVAPERRAVIPPGVVLDSPLETPVTLPGKHKVICVGPLGPGRGLRDAIWTLDILRFLYDDLHLFFIGTGPEQGRLEEFAQVTRTSAYVHFLGAVPAVAPLLAQADVVWVLSPGRGGTNATLEAMAVGRPVIATQGPDRAALLVPDQTGLFVPVGDKATLARRTRQLLDDSDLRRRLGEAGRQRAGEQFDAAQMVRRFSELYEDLGPKPANSGPAA